MKHVAECPSCLNEFQTTVEAAQDGLRCPKCETGFVPTSLKQYDDAPRPRPPVAPLPPEGPKAPPARVLASMKIIELESRGSHLTVLCWILTGLGVLFFGVAMLGEASATSAKTETWPWLVAAGFFTLAILAAFFSHLNYIRAALEKR